MQHIATKKDLIRKNKNSVHFNVFCLLKLLVGKMVVLWEKEHLLLKSHVKKKNVNYISLEHIIYCFFNSYEIYSFSFWTGHCITLSDAQDM